MEDWVAHCTGFDWDDGNRDKNQLKHDVSTQECEEVFSNQPLIVQSDAKHSHREPRFFVLGRTTAGRPLYVVFTIRHELIRVISARDMNRIERGIYGKKIDH